MAVAAYRRVRRVMPVPNDGCGARLCINSDTTIPYLCSPSFLPAIRCSSWFWGDIEIIAPRDGPIKDEQAVLVGLTNSHEKTVCDVPRATRANLQRQLPCLRLTWSLAEETICPLDKVLHVRCVSVTAVVLAPGELARQQALVYGRHFCRPVVA